MAVPIYYQKSSSEVSLPAAGKWLTAEVLWGPKTDFKRSKPRMND